MSNVRELIAEECENLKQLLLLKNEKYGDSAIHPNRIFSSASPEELLRVRIDDKLARMSNGVVDDEDTIQDMAGYLILLKVCRRVHGGAG